MCLYLFFLGRWKKIIHCPILGINTNIVNINEKVSLVLIVERIHINVQCHNKLRFVRQIYILNIGLVHYDIQHIYVYAYIYIYTDVLCVLYTQLHIVVTLV